MDRATLNEHFNFYLENEQQFKSTERYVYVSKKCKTTFSFAYANLLMNICSDFESLIRAYFDKENSQPINIDQIIALIQSDKDLSAIFSESCQYQKTDYETLTPLDIKTNQKNNIKSFDWWTANNSVKHNKVANITRANQKTVLTALGALYILNRYVLSITAKQEGGTDIFQNDQYLFKLTMLKSQCKPLSNLIMREMNNSF